MVTAKDKETAFRAHPQIERYALYRDMIHKNFRFDRRTIVLSLIFGAAVPLFIFSKIKQSQQDYYSRVEGRTIPQINPFDLVRETPISEEERRLRRYVILAFIKPALAFWRHVMLLTAFVRSHLHTVHRNSRNNTSLRQTTRNISAS